MELPPILRLPDEILHQILSSASQTAPYPRSGRLWDHKLPSTVLKISLTCSQFRRLSRSFIFESIHIKQGLPPPPPWPKQPRTSVIPAVHARFRDEPELRSSCRKLQLDIDEMSRNHYVMITDLLTCLVNVRYLSVSGFFGSSSEEPVGGGSGSRSGAGHGEEEIDDDTLIERHDMWALIGLVNRHMRNLELLRCKDRWGHDCRGSDLISNIDIPSLKRLDIEYLARSSRPPDLKKQRTAPFTSLSLSIHDEPPDMVISQIISWPKELTEFRLHKSWAWETYRIDIPMVQSWLATHKSTLKYIKIEELQFGPPLHRALESPLGLNTAEFTSLEHLHLSRWLWGRQEGLMLGKPLDTSWARDEAELLLLAPKLRVFEWDFTPLGSGARERWTAFGANEEEWLRVFAQVAISQKDKHSLEEIRIQFEPEDMGSGRESEVYPWDRMDRVREEVVQMSGGLVTLTYNKPVFSREEWKEHLERERELEMERGTQDT